MSKTYFEQLKSYVESRYPGSLKGIEEASGLKPERFHPIANKHLNWLWESGGEKRLHQAIDDYVSFSYLVNRSQYQYELAGKYENDSFDHVFQEVYNQQSMENYLWGLFLANFLWSHHAEICLFFEDRFIPKIQENSKIVELAPGHGAWGIWAVSETKGTTLEGFDISPASLSVCRAVAHAAGVSNRTHYENRNILELEFDQPVEVCLSFLLAEHLEDPNTLFSLIGKTLKSKGIAFITAALTAAQPDHIYEFKKESELISLCENNGLRVAESLSVHPMRTLKEAKYLPRTMAIIAYKE